MDVVTLVVLGTVLVSWQFMERPDKSKWMLVPFRCYGHKEWHRVITHAFVHADWMHLAFNMFVLYEFGRVVNAELAGLGWMGFPALTSQALWPVPSPRCKSTSAIHPMPAWERQVRLVLCCRHCAPSHAHVVAVFCHPNSGVGCAFLLVRKPNATTRSRRIA